MKKQILELIEQVKFGNLNCEDAADKILELINVLKIPSWMTEDDLNVAKLYYKNGYKLQAIKHIRDIVIKKSNIDNPLQWAKSFVENYCC